MKIEYGRNELFSEYVYDKAIVANKLNIDESELIDYLIEGIPDDQARMQRFGSKETLLRAFEKISLNKKSAFNKNKESPKDSSENKITNKFGKDSQGSKGENQNSNKPSDKIQKRCYNCLAVGHFSKDCKKDKRPEGSCFICSSMEHKINDCPDKKKKSSNSEINNIEHGQPNSEFHPNIKLHFEDNYEQFEINLIALLDSGSPISLIKSKFLNSFIILPCGDKMNEYFGVNGSKLNIIGKTKPICTLYDNICPIELLVVEDYAMVSSVVLDRDAFKAFGLEISKQNKDSIVEDIKSSNIDYSDNHSYAIMNIEVDKTNTIDLLKINPQIPYNYQEELKRNFEKIYVLAEKPEKPKTKAELSLKLKKHQPFKFLPRRLAFAEKNNLKNIIDNLEYWSEE